MPPKLETTACYTKALITDVIDRQRGQLTKRKMGEPAHNPASRVGRATSQTPLVAGGGIEPPALGYESEPAKLGKPHKIKRLQPPRSLGVFIRFYIEQFAMQVRLSEFPSEYVTAHEGFAISTYSHQVAQIIFTNTVREVQDRCGTPTLRIGLGSADLSVGCHQIAGLTPNDPGAAL